MDDKTNNDKNQTEQPPAYETVTVDDQVNQNSSGTINLQPEEVAPDVVSPDISTPAISEPFLSNDGEPVVYEENKNKYFLIGGVVFFLILVFFVLFIFFRPKIPASQQKTVNLTYWGLWEDKEIFAPLISAYQTKNPNVKIDYQKKTITEYREKLIARSQNGQGPDIFRFHNTWVPQLKVNDESILSALPENIMSNEEYEKTFYPVIVKDLKINGRYYGLALEIDGLVLVINDGLFKKAGITSPPTSWTEDLIEVVNKLSVRDENKQLITAGIALGTTENIDHFSDIFGLLLVQNGGNLSKLDSPEAAQVLEVYRKFAEPPTNYWDEGMPNSTTAFIQEKVAMIIVPSWQILTIKAINPDIKIKVVPVPKGPQGKQISIANYWVEGVSKYSKNQIEAWKFLKFLTEKEQMTKLYEMQAKTRLFGEPYSRIDLGATLAQHEYLGAVITQANNFISLPIISKTQDNGLNDGIIAYLKDAINATIQGVAYTEALINAKKGVDQLFLRYKIQ